MQQRRNIYRAGKFRSVPPPTRPLVVSLLEAIPGAVHGAIISPPPPRRTEPQQARGGRIRPDDHDRSGPAYDRLVDNFLEGRADGVSESRRPEDRRRLRGAISAYINGCV